MGTYSTGETRTTGDPFGLATLDSKWCCVLVPSGRDNGSESLPGSDSGDVIASPDGGRRVPSGDDGRRGNPHSDPLVKGAFSACPGVGNVLHHKKGEYHFLVDSIHYLA